MLIVARKKGEQVTVGDVTFTICKIGKNRVQVGIDAPKEMKILRVEKEKPEGGRDAA